MCAVAEGEGFAVFAAAEAGFSTLFQCEFHGFKVGALVAAVTKRLALAFTAGAEPVVAGFEFDDAGFLLCNSWL